MKPKLTPRDGLRADSLNDRIRRRQQFVLDHETRDEFLRSAVESFKNKLWALLNQRPSKKRTEFLQLCDTNTAIYLLDSTITAARKLPRRK
jgi:hypothetical protein